MRTFFAAMWPTFFIRVSPASRKAKPACMNITSIAARTTQTVLAAMASSLLSSSDLHLLEAAVPVRWCVTLKTGVVQQIPSPDSWPVRAASTIASTTASASSSRTTNVSCALGRNRDSKTRPAVLVRDAALAAVPDRLDHRDADVTGVLLDRVHHRLDPVADDDRLDLHHRPAS